jgi:cell division protein FtsW
VIGEELGFVGVLVVIRCSTGSCAARSRSAVRRCARPHLRGPGGQGHRHLDRRQTFINMGVNLGLLPTKGLTLPL